MSLPHLVLLYDPSLVQPTCAPVATPYFAPYDHYFWPPIVPGAPAPQSTTRSPGTARSNPVRIQTPQLQLPPTLTDEQLARLDRQTREAFDEGQRRVLEGVSGTIYRCVEELPSAE